MIKDGKNGLQVPPPLSERDQWLMKREEILRKFTHDFATGQYKWDNIFQNVVQALMRDKSPYEIIEILILDKIEMMRKMEDFIIHHAHPNPLNHKP